MMRFQSNLWSWWECWGLNLACQHGWSAQKWRIQRSWRNLLGTSRILLKKNLGSIVKGMIQKLQVKLETLQAFLRLSKSTHLFQQCRQLRTRIARRLFQLHKKLSSKAHQGWIEIQLKIRRSHFHLTFENGLWMSFGSFFEVMEQVLEMFRDVRLSLSRKHHQKKSRAGKIKSQCRSPVLKCCQSLARIQWLTSIDLFKSSWTPFIPTSTPSNFSTTSSSLFFFSIASIWSKFKSPFFWSTKSL